MGRAILRAARVEGRRIRGLTQIPSVDSSWRIGHIFGVPVEIHVSWLFIFALIVWSLGADYFPMHHPGVSGPGNWIGAVAAALLFFASILAHEVAHSIVARTQGIPVERITLFALGGVSALGREASRPRSELLVALVGPTLSVVIGALLWMLWRTFLVDDMALGAIVFYLAYGNLALGVFNLLPAFPLDGGRALRALLWATRSSLDRATLRALTVTRLVCIGLVGVGLWQVVVAEETSGLWLTLVAWVIWGAADQERARILIELALRGRNIAPLVRFELLTLDAEDTLARAAERIAVAPPQPLYPVLDGDDLVGLVTPEMFRATPAGPWGVTKMHWFARRGPTLPIVALETDALDALSKLDELKVDALPVGEPGAGVIGLLERGSVARWIEFSPLAGRTTGTGV